MSFRTPEGPGPAAGATGQLPGRGDGHGHQLTATLGGLDMQAFQAEQGIAAGTVVTGGGAGAHPVVLDIIGVLVMDQFAWSLLILGDPDPYPALTTPWPPLPTECPKSPFPTSESLLRCTHAEGVVGMLYLFVAAERVG